MLETTQPHKRHSPHSWLPIDLRLLPFTPPALVTLAYVLASVRWPSHTPTLGTKSHYLFSSFLPSCPPTSSPQIMLPMQSIEAPVPTGPAEEQGEVRQQKPKTLPCKYCSKRFR
jgi:hypothetical protein